MSARPRMKPLPGERAAVASRAAETPGICGAGRERQSGRALRGRRRARGGILKLLENDSMVDRREWWKWEEEWPAEERG